MQNEKKSRISLEVRDFFVTLPTLNNRGVHHKGDDDARNHIGHYLCQFTSEVCHRPHYTNSGGHPVEYSPCDEICDCLATGNGCRFPVVWGDVLEGDDRRPCYLENWCRASLLSPLRENNSLLGNKIFPHWEPNSPTLGIKTAQGGSLHR